MHEIRPTALPFASNSPEYAAMPTVPMYLQHPQPTDASHAVFAPGGYEWWHFDAEDEAGQVHLIADFFDGYPFHRHYAAEYDKFLRKPTRLRPPLPEAYPCVSLAVCDGDNPTAAFFEQFPARALQTSADGFSIKLGENSITRDGDDISVRLRGHGGPWGLREKLTARSLLPVSAAARFRCVNEPRICEVPVDAAGAAVPRHRWVSYGSAFDVEGTVSIERDDKTIEFRGRGYHDHYFGSHPLVDGMVGHLRGRVIRGEDVCSFQIPAPTGSAWRACLIEGDTVKVIPSLESDASARPWAKWLEWVSVGDVLRLHTPKKIGFTPHGNLITYRARWEGYEGSALCECMTAPDRRSVRW